MFLGLVLLLWCVRDFSVSGKGTLAPWDPPKRLVMIGLYRHVRNPMYVGVVTLVAGWAVLYLSPILLGYALILAIAFHIRVLTYEEPWLAGQFGNAWQEYRSHVGRWLPRFSPWKGGS
jgi:protein-S-isoprenylcysteine O-methyltransferase Ste14